MGWLQDIFNPNVDAVPWLDNPFNNGGISEKSQNANQTTAETVRNIDQNKEFGRFGGNIYNRAGDVIGRYNEQNVNPSDQNVQYSGNTQASQDAAQKAQTIGMLDEQTAAIDNALGNTGATRQSGMNQINDAYNKGKSRLNDQLSGALSGYETQRSDTKRDFSRSTEDINSNSANKYHALMRMLGRSGAGRSSAAENVVPYAVAQDASKSRGEVADTYGVNMRNLKTAEDNTKKTYDTSVQDLNDQKLSKEASLENDIKSKESQYHSTRAELLAKRAKAAGGDWNTVKGAMATDIAKRDEIDRALASLLDNYRNPVNVKDVVVSKADMSNYATDLNGVSVNDPNGQGYSTDTSAEYLARIKDEEKRKAAAQAAGAVA